MCFYKRGKTHLRMESFQLKSSRYSISRFSLCCSSNSPIVPVSFNNYKGCYVEAMPKSPAPIQPQVPDYQLDYAHFGDSCYIKDQVLDYADVMKSKAIDYDVPFKSVLATGREFLLTFPRSLSTKETEGCQATSLWFTKPGGDSRLLGYDSDLELLNLHYAAMKYVHKQLNEVNEDKKLGVMDDCDMSCVELHTQSKDKSGEIPVLEMNSTRSVAHMDLG